MRILLKSYCTFCSKLLDERQLLERGGGHAAGELGALDRAGGLPRCREDPVHIRRYDRSLLHPSTSGQVATCTAMLESEIARRDRAKWTRLHGRARFPAPKSVEGFDWSNVAFPDGWGRDLGGPPHSAGCSPTWPRRGPWSWTSSTTRPSTWTGRGFCTRSYWTATRGGV